MKRDCRCPECIRKLTLGVHHRVEELADREAETVRERKIPFKSIVPLAEIIAEVKGVKSPQSKRVLEEYFRLTDELANEFTLLLDTPIEEIRRAAADEHTAEAIRRMRAGQLEIEPGYDGVYGVVSIFGTQGPPAPSQKVLL